MLFIMYSPKSLNPVFKLLLLLVCDQAYCHCYHHHRQQRHNCDVIIVCNSNNATKKATAAQWLTNILIELCSEVVDVVKHTFAVVFLGLQQVLHVRKHLPHTHIHNHHAERNWVSCQNVTNEAAAPVCSKEHWRYDSNDDDADNGWVDWPSTYHCKCCLSHIKPVLFIITIIAIITDTVTSTLTAGDSTDLIKDITDAVRRTSLRHKCAERHWVQNSRCKVVINKVSLTKEVRLNSKRQTLHTPVHSKQQSKSQKLFQQVIDNW